VDSGKCAGGSGKRCKGRNNRRGRSHSNDRPRYRAYQSAPVPNAKKDEANECGEHTEQTGDCYCVWNEEGAIEDNSHNERHQEQPPKDVAECIQGGSFVVEALCVVCQDRG